MILKLPTDILFTISIDNLKTGKNKKTNKQTIKGGRKKLITSCVMELLILNHSSTSFAAKMIFFLSISKL